jgi:hypothetical protein
MGEGGSPLKEEGEEERGPEGLQGHTGEMDLAHGQENQRRRGPFHEADDGEVRKHDRRQDDLERIGKVLAVPPSPVEQGLKAELRRRDQGCGVHRKVRPDSGADRLEIVVLSGGEKFPRPGEEAVGPVTDETSDQSDVETVGAEGGDTSVSEEKGRMARETDTANIPAQGPRRTATKVDPLRCPVVPPGRGTVKSMTRRVKADAIARWGIWEAFRDELTFFEA